MKVGIMGAGKIAATMAQTINGMKHPEVELYAIASRSLEKALDFAQKNNVTKAFGSYEEMLKDPDVDLIYIATPHSEHYSNIKLCIQYKKAMLVEKAFWFAPLPHFGDEQITAAIRSVNDGGVVDVAPMHTNILFHILSLLL